MGSFLIRYALFHALNVINTVILGGMFIVYMKTRQNILVRSGCLVSMMMGCLLMVNLARKDAHIYGGTYCRVQAMLFNYYHVSMHAHYCFLIFNNCYSALGWRFLDCMIKGRNGSKTRMRMGILLIGVLLAPVIPIVRMGVSVTRVEPRSFYCVVVDGEGWRYRMWVWGFSIGGMLMSVYFVYETWKLRREAICLSKHSQFSNAKMIKLAMNVLIYAIVSIASLWLEVGEVEGSRMPKRAKIPKDYNPFINEKFCDSGLDGKGRQGGGSEEWCKRVFCSSWSIFVPILLGMGLFLMFGLGSVAMESYRGWMNGVMRCIGLEDDCEKEWSGKRRRSSLNIPGGVEETIQQEQEKQDESRWSDPGIGTIKQSQVFRTSVNLPSIAENELFANQIFGEELFENGLGGNRGPFYRYFRRNSAPESSFTPATKGERENVKSFPDHMGNIQESTRGGKLKSDNGSNHNLACNQNISYSLEQSLNLDINRSLGTSHNLNINHNLGTNHSHPSITYSFPHSSSDLQLQEIRVVNNFSKF